MNFRTYEDLVNCIHKNIGKVPHDIDLVVGIPRSGTMVANIIALSLNLPFMDIEDYLNNRVIVTGTTRKCQNWIRCVDQAKHVLIVDDSVSSGKAVREAKERLKGRNEKYTYLAVYALAASCKMVDIFLEICEQPRMFEWNYMHHWALEYCCMDIDGVLCEDPTLVQNDDGKKYERFLEEAIPKFVPTQKVGYLVSCRMEKYREKTEAWLKKYNVDYGKLVLIDNIGAKERALGFDHAKFKADFYKKTDAILFFESNYDQALRICELSGKPVYCIENRKLITSNNVIEKLKVRNKEWKVTVKRAVKKITKRINYVK